MTSTAEIAAPPRESYGKLFGRFLRFGFLAWGGPAVYQVLPGPEAHELCVYFGMLARTNRRSPGRPWLHAAWLGLDVRTILVLPDLWSYITAVSGGLSWLSGSGRRADLLTFGGAYTVIPFLQRDAVALGGWMTNQQFLDGVA
jgi:chromate transport protein ChrA